jgi:hypothetical protein
MACTTPSDKSKNTILEDCIVLNKALYYGFKCVIAECFLKNTLMGNKIVLFSNEIAICFVISVSYLIAVDRDLF